MAASSQSASREVACTRQRALVPATSERATLRVEADVAVAGASISLVHFRNGVPVTDSPTIAREFGRRHDNVMQTLGSLTADGSINLLDFKEITYVDGRGRSQPAIELTERGTLIAMPFIGGRRSRQGHVRLVDAFMQMRDDLESVRQGSHSHKPAWAKSKTPDRERLLGLVAGCVARHGVGFVETYRSIHAYVGVRRFREMTCEQVREAEGFAARMLEGTATIRDLTRAANGGAQLIRSQAELPLFAVNGESA